MDGHEIWGPEGFRTQEDGQAMNSGKDRGHGRRPAAMARRGAVSLFHPGRPLAELPPDPDLRAGREVFLASPDFAPPNPARVWESIPEITPDMERLVRNGLFANPQRHPAARHFDMLRTRVAQAMARHGWTRLAITSPGPGCGKSLVAANLALSLARLPACRTVLLDLDLRKPGLAALFGQKQAPALSEFLLGEQPLESTLRRIGRNLALGLNGVPVPLSAEMLLDPEFLNAMTALRELLQPDLVVMDTPPALGSDDVIALAGQVDALLLVCDGTRTAPDEISDCEHLFEGQIPLLGVVLNRAQDRALTRRDMTGR